MTTIIHVSEGGITKNDLISMAFEDCRLAGYDFDRTPEESLSVLRLLETMMRGWPWNKLGYFHSGNEADKSNIPDDATEGVVKALALRLMGNKGKAIPESFRPVATQAINYVRAQYATVTRIPYAQATVRGAGARRYQNCTGPFFPDYSQEEA
jgi:hypothetical protein